MTLDDITGVREVYSIDDYRDLNCISYGPNNEIAVGYSNGQIDILVPMLGSGTELVKYPSGIVGVAYSPDGKHVASCDFRNQIRVKDLASAAEKDMSLGEALCVEFTKDSKKLGVAFKKSKMRIFDTETLEEVVAEKTQSGWKSLVKKAVVTTGKGIAKGAKKIPGKNEPQRCPCQVP